MRKVTLIVSTLVAALALAATAGAAVPRHLTFTSRDQFVDTQTCGFPIAGDFVFTNDVIEFDNADGTPAALQLHQSNVGTLTANGVTLKENEHVQTFVTFVGGSPTQAVHAGVLLHLVGPGGTSFLVAGQEVWEVENGFDHTLLSFHGIDFGGSDATFCAAFG
jgi:hypothetical protein